MSACEETCVATRTLQSSEPRSAPDRHLSSPYQVRDRPNDAARRSSVRSGEYTRNQRFGSAGHSNAVSSASVRAAHHAPPPLDGPARRKSRVPAPHGWQADVQEEARARVARAQSTDECRRAAALPATPDQNE